LARRPEKKRKARFRSSVAKHVSRAPCGAPIRARRFCGAGAGCNRSSRRAPELAAGSASTGNKTRSERPLFDGHGEFLRIRAFFLALPGRGMPMGPDRPHRPASWRPGRDENGPVHFAPAPRGAALRSAGEATGFLAPWTSILPKSSRPSRRPREDFARAEMMPHARGWDEDEVFSRRRAAQGGGARLRRHLCEGGRPAARRSRGSTRTLIFEEAGAGACGLDRRLSLDPQTWRPG